MTQVELLTAMIDRLRVQGFRPAAPWEVSYLGPESLFTSARGGPCFVRIADHGEADPADLAALLERYAARDAQHEDGQP